MNIKVTKVGDYREVQYSENGWSAYSGLLNEAEQLDEAQSLRRAATELDGVDVEELLKRAWEPLKNKGCDLADELYESIKKLDPTWEG